MAHEVKKKFLSEIAYTERDFQVSHTALGNLASFEYELNDVNTQLLKILNGNAIINGYFYEFEGDRLLTMPHIKGNAYVMLTVNKASGQVSFSVDDRPKPMENEFEHNVIVFVVEMNFDKIVEVNRTTIFDVSHFVTKLNEKVKDLNNTAILITANEDVDVILTGLFNSGNYTDKRLTLYIGKGAKNAPDADYKHLFEGWNGHVDITQGGAKVVVYDSYGNMFTKSYTSNMAKNNGWMNSGEAWYQVFTGSRDLGVNKTVTFNRVSFYARGVRVTMTGGQTFTRLYTVNGQGANMSFMEFHGEHFSLRAYVNNANVQLQTGLNGGTVIKIEVLA